MSAAPAVIVDDVSKRFGTRWALARLDLTLATGECVMLAGHNGSGKTTLLRLLAGLLPPTFGDAQVFGASVKRDPLQVRAQTALLSHSSGHYDELSARENLQLHARLLGRDSADLVARVLTDIGLGERADTPVREFSAGMKKRLAIARTMLKRPPLVLLDEPFGELDPQGMEVVEQWIAAEKRAGTTIVLATHWLEHGRRLTDREVHLAGGRSLPATNSSA